MRLIRLISCLALAAGCVFAQGIDPLDVRGLVLEPGTNLPVGGAQVTLYEFVEDRDRQVIRSVYATATTDSRGAFQFHAERLGDYFLEVKKEGYSPVSAGGPPADTDAAEEALTLSRNQPARELRFNLMRPGQITGRLIDEDGKPVVGLQVSAQSNTQNNPALPPFLNPNAVTDKDGAFTISKLMPSQYVVRIAPRSGGPEVMMQKAQNDSRIPSFTPMALTESDLKAVDQDLETSDWPIPISPGASSNVGTITVHKTSYYRAHVSVLADECESKEMWTFSAVTTPLLGFTPIPCMKEFLVRNLKPGTYWFTLSNLWDGDKKGFALASVEVNRENVEVKLTMTPGTTVKARMVAAQGATLPAPSPIMLLAAPVNWPLRSESAKPDSEGNFFIKGLAPTPYRIGVQGLPGKYYVKEFRFDGISAPGGVITPSADGKLEIVVDDQAATVTGSVMDGDKPAYRASVLLVEWPGQDMVGGAPIDQDGKFRVTGIAPGEYRLLAIPQPTEGKVPDLTRFLENAEKVTLERGGAQNVSLKLTDTTR